MTNVTNQRKDRRVDVRGIDPNTKVSKIYRIAPGETVNVHGFDKDRPFNKDLLEAGDIKTGGKAAKESGDDAKATLLATLTDAQTAYKQAKDKAEQAQTDVREDNSDANKKAFGLAKEALKKAEREVELAQKAFDAG